MTSFVLVHGAFHGGWCWEEVAAILINAGHDVHTPTLPTGSKDAVGIERNITLSDHIQVVVDLIERAELKDIVLVGHSLGGMIVTGVADRCHSRVAHLVYLDAFVPTSGQSVRDLALEPMYQSAVEASYEMGGGQVLPVIFPVEKFVDYSGDAAANFTAKLMPQPFLTIVEPVYLRNPPVARRTFVYCSAVPFGLFENFAETARTSSDWTYVDLPTSHDAMILMLNEVAHILLNSV